MIQTTLTWHLAKEELPEKDGSYLVVVHNETHITQLDFVTGEDGGWNCYRYRDGTVGNKFRFDLDVIWLWAEENACEIVKEIKEAKGK